MRKGLALGVLVLILALLPAVSMAGGKGPKPPTPSDTCDVTFEGPDVTGSGTLTADSRGSSYRLYTPVGEDETTILMFEDIGTGVWKNKTDDEVIHDFAGTHGDENDGDLLIQIHERTKEAYIEYWFGRYTDEDATNGVIDPRYVGWYKYQLAGTGDWDGKSAADGTIRVNGETFSICQLIWEASTKRSGKSATGVRTPQLWAGQLDFTVEIEP